MKLNEIKSIIGLARSSSPPPGQDEIIESSRLQRVSGGEKFGQQIRDAFSIVKIDQISMKFVVHQWTCLRVFFVFNKCVFFVCVCVILLDLTLECVSVCLPACLSVCMSAPPLAFLDSFEPPYGVPSPDLLRFPLSTYTLTPARSRSVDGLAQLLILCILTLSLCLWIYT